MSERLVRKLHLLLIIIICLVSVHPVQSAAPVKAVRSDAGVLITQGEQKVLFYQIEPKSVGNRYICANYIHPLYGLDGSVLTEEFPADHLHHRGVFWAWHQILVGGKPVADQWALEDFRWEFINTELINKSNGTAGLQVRVLWKSPEWQDSMGKPKPFVEEQTTVLVHPGTDRYRLIDVVLSLRALENNVQIGGADDEKGYGGFSARIRLPDDIQFIGSTGSVTPKTTAVKAGPWLNITGSLGAGGQPAGLGILTHPTLPNYPAPWILRASSSMQNAVFPGREPVALSLHEPLTLGYRMVVHDGSLTPEDLESLQQQFAQESS